MKIKSLDLQTLRDGYQYRNFTPDDVINFLEPRVANDTCNTWIYRLSREELTPYLNALRDKDPRQLPLYGIPFAIKDNIDLAGVPTTAACPEFSYTPTKSAFVVEQLIAAGAIPIGKTNLDQFATGLNGTRSPFGECRNAFDQKYISGGSSSGSAVAVALGQVSFALGTDTAGSGRVPAAFNNLIGLKPTRGVLSTRGVVPACRSLDCVSVFSLNSNDAHTIFQQLAVFDVDESYARKKQVTPKWIGQSFRFGIPRSSQLEFFGDQEYQRLFQQSIDVLSSIGGVAVELDFSPLLQAASLLYDGPWLAERYAAIETFIEQHADAVFPVTRRIIEQGKQSNGVAAFKSFYRLADFKRMTETLLQSVDIFVSPTAPSHYTIEQLIQDPITLNTRLGYYTNFMNLLDLSAVAVPMSFTQRGLPFGVTLFSDAFMDVPLLALAQRIETKLQLPLGSKLSPSITQETISLPSDWTTVAVCGAHMQGLPLNHQLTERGAVLLEKTQSAKQYRLFALAGGPPYRPGMVRSNDGHAIELELWALPKSAFGSFVTLIPSPLGIGTVELIDGRRVQGFVCESYATENAIDISHLGGWRNYIKTKSS